VVLDPAHLRLGPRRDDEYAQALAAKMLASTYVRSDGW
jgi:hypothetical protein